MDIDLKNQSIDGGFNNDSLLFGANNSSSSLPSIYKSNTIINYVKSALNLREVLTSTRNYYVRTDGNDNNNGLTNNSGGAFQTIQKAIDVASTLDCASYVCRILVQDGTYNTSTLQVRSPIGYGNFIIEGNKTNPGNVVLNITGSIGVLFDRLNTLTTFTGFELRSASANSHALEIRYGCNVLYGRLKFSTGTYNWRSHIRVNSGGQISTLGGGDQDYEINDSPGWFHIYCVGGILSMGNAPTITINNNPSWGLAFIQVRDLGVGLIPSTTVFSGSATGSRYNITTNGVLSVQGGNTTFLPGNTSGSVSNGGIYS